MSSRTGTIMWHRTGLVASIALALSGCLDLPADLGGQGPRLAVPAGLEYSMPLGGPNLAPDERGPSWVRLVGFDTASGAGFELRRPVHFKRGRPRKARDRT